jgi:hypothetical protein
MQDTSTRSSQLWTGALAVIVTAAFVIVGAFIVTEVFNSPVVPDWVEPAPAVVEPYADFAQRSVVEDAYPDYGQRNQVVEEHYTDYGQRSQADEPYEDYGNR